MKQSDLKTAQLPDAPGIYFFMDAENSVLYIGKATSLRDRVRSYFSNDLIETRGPAIVQMVARAERVAYQETDSVLEALIQEANAIKKYKPKYNSREKDNKSFNYVVITKEAFPRVLVVRGRDLATQWDAEDIKYTFGPFPQGAQFRAAMKLIRKLFPFRDAKCEPQQGRPCFNQQIGLCPGVCIGTISKTEYSRTIQHLRLFFSGKKSALIKQLEREMEAHAAAEEFERAAAVKRTLFALQHIQDVSLLKAETKTPNGEREFRIEGYDIAHTGGTEVVGVMTVVTDGELQKNEYRKFRIKEQSTGGDVPALKEMLQRRMRHNDWRMPELVVVDGGKAQINAARAVIESTGIVIPVIGVVKDEHHKPREILGGTQELRERYERDILRANSEAHRFAQAYHFTRRGKRFLS